MNIPAEFDDIRPYTPEELPQIFEELLSDKDFQAVIQSVMPNVPLEMLAAQLRHCKTNLDVQKAFFHKLLHDIMQQHSDGFDMDASSLPDTNQSYTFISNHRDIVLDPGFLSVGLLDNGFPTTVEIAIEEAGASEQVVHRTACPEHATNAGIICTHVTVHSFCRNTKAGECVDCTT